MNSYNTQAMKFKEKINLYRNEVISKLGEDEFNKLYINYTKTIVKISTC